MEETEKYHREHADQTLAFCRQHFAPEVALQAAQDVHFADFRRDPVLDPDTGEPLEVQPKFYESFPGGMEEIRYLLALTPSIRLQKPAKVRPHAVCP